MATFLTTLKQRSLTVLPTSQSLTVMDLTNLSQTSLLISTATFITVLKSCSFALFYPSQILTVSDITSLLSCHLLHSSQILQLHMVLPKPVSLCLLISWSVHEPCLIAVCQRLSTGTVPCDPQHVLKWNGADPTSSFSLVLGPDVYLQKWMTGHKEACDLSCLAFPVSLHSLSPPVACRICPCVSRVVCLGCGGGVGGLKEYSTLVFSDTVSFPSVCVCVCVC